MKKILKFLNDYLEETICIILMSVMTIIIFIQVIMRYVMHNSLSWSEELARYCFVWLIYIGVAYGCKLMKHIKIDAALKLFPEKVRPYITIVGELLVLAFAAYIVVTGVELTYKQLIATAGSIGVIIPPSIPMVIYGVSTSTSISSLFMAGFLPGILIGFSLIVVSYLYCKKQGWKGDERKYTAKEKLAAIWDAKWALLNPIIILGGIYAGIFTPTEAAAVAAVYAFICGAFIYREFNIKEMFATIGNACNTTGTTMVIIGCATAFTKILTIEKIPGAITNGIINFTDNKILILLLINVLLLIVGCFMDTTPAMMVLAPILLPIAVQFGVDPIHFGIVMVVNLAIGFITPPLGINLFVASRVGRSDLETVCSGIIKFILVMVVDLLLITFIPAISMTLPNIFMK